MDYCTINTHQLQKTIKNGRADAMKSLVATL